MCLSIYSFSNRQLSCMYLCFKVLFLITFGVVFIDLFLTFNWLSWRWPGDFIPDFICISSVLAGGFDPVVFGGAVLVPPVMGLVLMVLAGCYYGVDKAGSYGR